MKLFSSLRHKTRLVLVCFLPCAIAACALWGSISDGLSNGRAKSFSSSLFGGSKTNPGNRKIGTEAQLTQKEAAARAVAVHNLTYDLKLDLSSRNDGVADGDKETFLGKVDLEFDLTGSAAPVFLDFHPGGSVDSLIVNGWPISRAVYQGGRIDLSGAALKAGHNKAEIAFQQKYTNDGTGLARFVDPEDQRVYVYTQFESYYANEMFPCFDQPDIKAKLKMQVTVPASWQVISTTRESSVRAVEGRDRKSSGAKKQWTFPESPPLSTYLFSLHAGPFHSWKSVWKSAKGAPAQTVPLRLFARESVAKFVVPDDFFMPTRQGFDFFTRYFDYPYAFLKYDQVICPDFTAIAMENVAAVTFAETYLTRGGATVEQKEDLANTVIHELAHHWFGDLVTMEWWNGLWLNESFASYMAALVLVENTKYKEAWISFRDTMKEPGYAGDREATAHPVDRDVPDTREAVTGFDDITYGKGASVLKQLIFRIGPEKFRDGVRLYFKTFAYKNTRLEDFFSILEKTSGVDLKKWSQVWLKTTGTDSVRVVYDCAAGQISRFELHLTPASGSVEPRPHRAIVGLFPDGHPIALGKTATVDYERAVTPVPEFIGQACPLMVLPNIEDHDYIQVQLDDKTLKAAEAHLQDVADPVTRHMFYSIFYRMVQDGEMLPQNYLKTVESMFPAEKNLKIGIEVLKTLAGETGDGFSSSFYYLPQQSSDEQKIFNETSLRFERMIWKKLEDLSRDPDWRKTLIESYIQFARSDEGQSHILSLFPRLDQDRRWDAIVKLSSLGNPVAINLLKSEKVRDSSEEGLGLAMAAEAAVPDLAVKKIWFNKLVSDTELPLEKKQKILDRILPAWQDFLRKDMNVDFYGQMPRLVTSVDQEFLEKFTTAFQPSVCTDSSVHDLSQFFAQTRETLPPTVLRVIRNELKEDDRCVRLRANAALSAIR